MIRLYTIIFLFSFSLYYAQATPTESINEGFIRTSLNRHLEQPLTHEKISRTRKLIAQYVLDQEDIVTPYLERQRNASRGQLVSSMSSFCDPNCVTWRIVELDDWGTNANHLLDVSLISEMLHWPLLAQRSGEKGY